MDNIRLVPQLSAQSPDDGIDDVAGFLTLTPDLYEQVIPGDGLAAARLEQLGYAVFEGRQ